VIEIFNQLTPVNDVVIRLVGQTQPTGGGFLTSRDNMTVPFLTLLVPLFFALYNMLNAYLGAKRHKELKKSVTLHKWLLQQKNDFLVSLKKRLNTPLEVIQGEIEELAESGKLSSENNKTLIENIQVAKTRVNNIVSELQRTSFSVSLESVDLVPFYRSVTTIGVLASTVFIMVIIDSILVSLDLINITLGVIILQSMAFLVATIITFVASLYKRTSDRLIAHDEASLKSQRAIDSERDHMISLAVKIITADLEGLRRDLRLFVAESDGLVIRRQTEELDKVMERMHMLNNIENRTIQSEVKILNVEELIESMFRKYQDNLNKLGLQVEYFHRIGAANIQPSVVQDYALLSIALSEAFESILSVAQKQSIVTITSEHDLSNSSITISSVSGKSPMGVHKDGSYNEKAPQEINGIGLYIASQIMSILGGDIHMNLGSNGSSINLIFANNYIKQSPH
jgi:hypothetical protein